ncbi:MAG TPA: radical SAM protein [Terriglobales bacterium]|nr:radical SAM protein [Terriglobales bacterium]
MPAVLAVPRSASNRAMGRIAVKAILNTWQRTLRGRLPSLSLEITRECPLRCPGCYAYEDAHLGAANLRSLSDFRGQELVRRVLELVKEHKPLHLSIVGGDPLVRYRELDILLPELVRHTHVQVVTSAFRQIPRSWAKLRNLQLVVSIDGLQPEHDLRRKPATYERILRNIEGHHIAVHCTITSRMARRTGYLPEFVDFWSANPNVERIWMSIFTPQRGATNIECLDSDERKLIVEILLRICREDNKLDMREGVIREFLAPPASPDQCIFAKTTLSLSADLRTKVVPCQFGGNPDCSRCGCMASMALAAVGHRKILGPVTAGGIFWISNAIGSGLKAGADRIRHETRAA